MQKLLIIISLLFLISCGKESDEKITTTAQQPQPSLFEQLEGYWTNDLMQVTFFPKKGEWEVVIMFGEPMHKRLELIKEDSTTRLIEVKSDGNPLSIRLLPNGEEILLTQKDKLPMVLKRQ